MKDSKKTGKSKQLFDKIIAGGTGFIGGFAAFFLSKTFFGSWKPCQ